jgi:PAS domain S-box-containing protein
MESGFPSSPTPENLSLTSQPSAESDDRFRLVANAAPVMIWMSGPNAHCTFFNQQWLEFTGRPMGEELGYGWADNVHPDDLTHCMETYIQAFDRRKRFEIEYRLRRADGEYRWIFDTGIPLFDVGGDFTGYIGSCVDITDRKLAERSLRESEDRYRDLVENSGILFGAHDMQGKILSANQTVIKLSGFDRASDLVGRKIDEFLPSDVRHLFANYLDTITKQGHAHGLVRVRTKTGGERILEYNNSLRREGLDAPIVRCVGHDVTEGKRAEKALRESDERYRLVADNSQDLIGLLDLNGNSLYASPSHFYVLGYSSDELLHGNMCRFVSPEDAQAVLSAIRNIPHSRQTQILELSLRKKNGEWLEVEAIFSGIQDAGGSTCRILFAGRDITERKRAEQVSRRQTAALIRTLNLLAAEPALETFLGHVLRAITEQLKVSSCALYLHDPDNPAIPAEMTYENGKINESSRPLARPINSPPHLPWDEDPAFVLVKERRGPVVIEDASENPVLSREVRAWAAASGIKTILLLPLLQGDKLIGILSIRSRKNRTYGREEEELTQALAHQATLAVQLTRLAEEGQRSVLLQERNRMAQEIHDTLAQGFTGIVIQLEAADDALGESAEAARKHLRQASQLARDNLAEARRSVWALRPQMLEHSNLPKALKGLVEQITCGTAVQGKFAVHGTPQPLSSELERNLLRISQEALANSLRHSGAKNIDVAIVFGSRQVQLRIRDDGAGFGPNPSPDPNRGLGLTTMQTRAQSMGGRLRIKSRPGAGTLIQVTAPLRVRDD